MITFEISVNGNLLCRTGVGEFGILTAELMWARIQTQRGTPQEELTIRATSLAGELHSQWLPADLKLGDEIRIRIVDSDDFDEPWDSGTLDSLRPNNEQ